MSRGHLSLQNQNFDRHQAVTEDGQAILPSGIVEIAFVAKLCCVIRKVHLGAIMHRLLVFGAALVFSLALFSGHSSAGEMHKAARKGDIDALSSAIAQGADVNELDGVVGAPLHWAAARGHIEAVKFLVSSGADFDLRAAPPDKLSPLQLAASNGHLTTVSYLVGLDADFLAGVNGVGTPLHLAAFGDHGEVVSFLLDHGTSPLVEAENVFGPYPMHWAAQSGGLSAIQPLLDAGFPIDAPMHDGTTALHTAVFFGHVEFASTLLELGANPDSVSSHFTTPRILLSEQEKMKELFDKLPPE